MENGRLLVIYRRYLGLLLLSALLVCVLSLGIRADGYLDSVARAIDSLEKGAAADCVSAIDEALEYNANDPLAYAVLGTLYLSRSDLKRGDEMFRKAAQLDPQFVEAEYALGIRALIQKDLEGSLGRFLNAASGGFGQGSGGAVEYIKSLMSGLYTAPLDKSYPQDSAMTAMQALRLLKSGSYKESLSRWSDILSTIGNEGTAPSGLFGMGLSKETPLIVSHSPLKASVPTIVSQMAKAPKVSGRVTLKADLKNARNVMFVSFKIDGRLTGVMNTPPFEMVWDSDSVSDGLHTIRIEGSDFSGLVLSSKTMVVSVTSAKASTSGLASGESAAELRARLRELLALRPATETVNYDMAFCCAKIGDAKGRERALERAVACDPGFRDARKMLGAIYRGSAVAASAAKPRDLAIVVRGGPSLNTADFLSAFGRAKIPAVFMLDPVRMQGNARAVQNISEAGHRLGVAVIDLRGKDVSEKNICRRFFTGVSALRSLTGQGTRLFGLDVNRPGLSYPAFVAEFRLVDVAALGVTVHGETSELFIQNALRAAKKTRVLVLEDNNPVAVISVGEMLASLNAAKYRFVSLQQVMAR